MALFNFYPLLRSPRPINSTRFGIISLELGLQSGRAGTRPAVDMEI